MKGTDDMKSCDFRFGTMIVAALLLLSPSDGRALPTCSTPAATLCQNPTTADCDGDGFTNSEECNGFTTVGSAYTDPLTNITYPAAPVTIAGWQTRGDLSRTAYLDPSAPDLFVALSPAPETDVRGGGTKLGNADLSIYDSALGVTTHVVSPRAISLARFVKSTTTGSQKAILITEDLDETWYRGVQLGNCWQGTPNGQDGCTVWTNRVYKDVYENCLGTAGNCRTPNSSVSVARNGQDFSSLQLLYLKNVVAHEASHTTNLKKKSSNNYGFHYAPESGVVMEKSIKVDAANYLPDVVYYISTAYSSTDRTDALLK